VPAGWFISAQSRKSPVAGGCQARLELTFWNRVLRPVMEEMEKRSLAPALVAPVSPLPFKKTGAATWNFVCVKPFKIFILAL